MKIREDCPIYENPTESEAIELATKSWDTLRVLECDTHLIVGSGYGNTHESLVQYYGKFHGFKTRQRPMRGYPEYNETVYCGRYPDWNPLIFFHEGSGIMFCNLQDIGGPDRVKYQTWQRFLSGEHVKLMRIIAEYSELQTV